MCRGPECACYDEELYDRCQRLERELAVCRAVAVYAQHKVMCDKRLAHQCTCGLDDARKQDRVLMAGQM